MSSNASRERIILYALLTLLAGGIFLAGAASLLLAELVARESSIPVAAVR
jgi:hypothetical protein